MNIINHNNIIKLIELMTLEIGTMMICFKIKNYKIKKYDIIYLIAIVLNSILVFSIRSTVNYLVGSVFMIFSMSYICSEMTKEGLGASIISMFISLTINYIIILIEVSFIYVLNNCFSIKNDYISLIILVLMHSILCILIYRIKRIKHGLIFLKQKNKNDVIDITILNICTIIIFSIIIFSNENISIELSKNLIIGLAIFSIIMFIAIKKSIEAYYKQKLLIQDLNETKKELEDKKKEVEELEAENLSFSKKSHSLAHKQKSLEFKINKLLMKSENAEELGLQEDLKSISKQLQENSKLPNLDKTGIMEIDDMLSVMQEECRLNGIDFVLQLKGNIYQMTNNYITKEELSILIADHIKDAIIAINHIDNINKSIMVRLGKIDDYYGLYIYDSGVEFSKEVLSKLGKQPITSYPDEGGTGMGFMNTFDTLKKHNASLIIESIGKPSKDNYTKVIKIIFDNKNYYCLG